MNNLLNLKHYFSNYKYTNELDLISVVIKIFSLVCQKEKLTDKEEDILIFYIKYGYSEKTKNSILKDVQKNKIKGDTTPITRKHLDVINHSLKKKGYLELHPNNYRLKILAKDLQKLSDTFMNQNGEKLMYIIGFDKI